MLILILLSFALIIQNIYKQKILRILYYYFKINVLFYKQLILTLSL